MKKRYESVILMSGGLDSFVGYFFLDKKPQPVYFEIGSKYTYKELEHLFKIGHVFDREDQDIIFDDSLKFLGDYEQGVKAYVPYRNLFLAATAALKYSNTVYICGLKDDMVSDKNEQIFKEWSTMLSKTNNNENIQILSPFWDYTKVDVAKWFVKNYPQYDLSEYTLSCYSEKPGHCNNCPACFRRNTALYQVGISIPFYNVDIVNEYKSKLTLDVYDKERIGYMKHYINWLETQTWY